MLTNYFRIAWRNLWKNKVFSFLNIVGLAVGMGSALLILLWIQNEVSFDRFHANGDRIYEAWNRAVFDGKLQCWDNTPKILAPTLQQQYPEIEQVARTNSGWFVASAGEKKISSKYLIADPSFLSIFSFPLVRGNPKTVLQRVNDIVITEKMAKKMFGDEPAMNKVIRIDKYNFAVCGILKDLPPNTRFDFEYLLPFTHMRTLGWDDEYWGNNSVNTFVLLKPNTDVSQLNAKIKDITKKHSKGTEQLEVFLHPSRKWHLYSEFENGVLVGGEIDTVRLFGMIAAFILLVACINFMNLSTARSEKRAKEVGIRKVAGANKALLVMQFLGESLFIVLLAGLLSLFLVQISMRSFDTLVGKELVVPYSSPYFWIAAVFFVLVTGALAGSYPAFFLSSFKPAAVLKGTFKKVNAVVTPRRVLVVLQFSFAIVLIISTLVVVNQIRYAQNRSAGYDRNQLVYHFLTGTLNEKYQLVKNELLESGIASSVNRTSSPLTEVWSDSWGFYWEGKAADDKTDFVRFSSDEDLLKTAGLKIITGRDMDLKNFPTDSMGMLLNESAAKAMNFKDPIGHVVGDGDQEYHIIGVVKDFVIGSPYEPMRPMIIEGPKSNNTFNVVNVKVKNAASTMAAINKMESIFKKYNPQFPFEYHFVDEQYARKFDDTRRTAALSALFAGLTILISCLGLFGLASFVAEQRIKEIGIRKVLGASVISLWQMLSKDFIGLVLISLLIAIPTAYYFMNDWLQNFPYHTPLSWWIFASAGAGALAITLVTVSYQSIRAALSNPVKNLRTE